MEKVLLMLRLVKSLNRNEADYAQTCAFSVAFAFTEVEAMRIAKELHTVYPLFVERLADNYGCDVAEFIA